MLYINYIVKSLLYGVIPRFFLVTNHTGNDSLGIGMGPIDEEIFRVIFYNKKNKFFFYFFLKKKFFHKIFFSKKNFIQKYFFSFSKKYFL